MGFGVHGLFALWGRVAGSCWAWRGRFAARRGDRARAVVSFERAVACRPRAFRPLMDLGRIYLDAGEAWRAHRSLAQAREVAPARFARVVRRWIDEGQEGGEILRTVLSGGVIRRGWTSKVATPTAASVSKASAPSTPAPPNDRRVSSGHLPYGDCLDVDEYARFCAMPPITPAERESVDWDRLLADLLDD